MKKSRIQKGIRLILLSVFMTGVFFAFPKKALADTYNVWVGEDQFSDSQKTIYDKNGTGTATYDPEKKTLTFQNFKGVKAPYISGKKTYMVYADTDSLTILGDATLADKNIDYGIYLKSSDNCEIDKTAAMSIEAKTIAISTTKALNISGNLTSFSRLSGDTIVRESGVLQLGSEERANYSDYVSNLTVEGKAKVYGTLKISYTSGLKVYGELDVSDGIEGADGRITVDGGKLTVESSAKRALLCNTFTVVGNSTVQITTTDYTGADAYAVITSNFTCKGGSTQIDSSCGGIKVSTQMEMQEGTLTVKGDTTTLESGTGCIGICASRFSQTGGTLSVSAHEGLICQGDILELNGGTFAADCTQYAVFCKYKDHFKKAVDMEIEVPENGIVKDDGDSCWIAKEDGTVATKVELKGPQYFDLWIGGTQISSKNMDNIENILGGGTATFDPLSQALRFDGNVTGISGAYTLSSGDDVLIYVGGLIDTLTIEGDFKISSATTPYAVYFSDSRRNRTLIINGNVDMKGSKRAVCNEHGKCVINGSAVMSGADYGLHTGTLEMGENGSLVAEATAEEGRGVYIEELLTLTKGSIKATALGAKGIGFQAESGIRQEGGSLEAVAKGQQGRGLIVSGEENLTLTGGVLKATGDAQGAIGCKISGEASLNLEGGQMQVDLTNDEIQDTFAMACTKPVTIKSGSLTVDSLSCGMTAAGIQQSDGKVSVSAKGSVGVDLSGDGLTMQGGEFSASSAGYGIQAMKLYHRGGKLDVSGERAAVYLLGKDGLSYDPDLISMEKPTGGYFDAERHSVWSDEGGIATTLKLVPIVKPAEEPEEPKPEDPTIIDKPETPTPGGGSSGGSSPGEAADKTQTGKTGTGTGTSDAAEKVDSSWVLDPQGQVYYRILSTKKKTAAFVKPKNAQKKKITIPAKVTLNGKKYKVVQIDAGAFKNNEKLTQITIGKNVKKIGKEAFCDCKKLKTIIVKTTSLKKKNVGKNAFKGIHTNAKAKVPKKKKSAYGKIFKAKGMNGKKQKIVS
ncbi:MAG: leucine-rich repeat protein [Lachnospiraceae bacterium]|nr:leucine-rich repeat protein [Lachnospiraceae bacterium]